MQRVEYMRIDGKIRKEERQDCVKEFQVITYKKTDNITTRKNELMYLIEQPKLPSGCVEPYSCRNRPDSHCRKFSCIFLFRTIKLELGRKTSGTSKTSYNMIFTNKTCGTS